MVSFELCIIVDSSKTLSSPSPLVSRITQEKQTKTSQRRSDAGMVSEKSEARAAVQPFLTR